MSSDNLSSTLLIAAFAAMTSGFITYWITRESIVTQVIFDEQSAAFAEYVEGRMLGNKFKDLPDYESNPQYLSAVGTHNAARFKVAIFANNDTVLAAARTRNTGSGAAYREATVDAFNAMRLNLGLETVEPETLHRLLFDD